MKRGGGSRGNMEWKALQVEGTACAKALRWKKFVGQEPTKLEDTANLATSVGHLK